MAIVDFIVHRYNYLTAIVLMMIGLYIVISRGNLVKKIVGLNIFQTSVFIYYISIGKIFGGTAPIIIGGHGEEHAEPAAEDSALSTIDDQSAAIEDRIAALELAEGPHAPPQGSPQPEQTLGDALRAPPAGEAPPPVASLHADPRELPDTGSVKPAPEDPFVIAPPSTNDSMVAIPPPGTPDSYSIVPPEHVADALHHAAGVVYSNPLPHVLILTAIVVGVATTAVGLAIAVRIREAYGTVEEDELEAADDISEFGEDYAKMQEASA